MSTALKIKRDRQRRGVQPRPESILTVAMDDDSTVCMTEATLDTWWRSLSPEDKAEVWELALDELVDRHAQILYDATEKLATA